MLICNAIASRGISVQKIQSGLKVRWVSPPVGDRENGEKATQGSNQANHRTAEREAASVEFFQIFLNICDSC